MDRKTTNTNGYNLYEVGASFLIMYLVDADVAPTNTEQSLANVCIKGGMQSCWKLHWMSKT